MRANGCSRWRSCAGSVRDGWRRSRAPSFSASTNSFAPSASTARPRRASRALSPWAQKRLTAYADGVNAFIDSHALPPEFLLAGDHPEPWKPADTLVVAKLEAYQLSQSFRLKLLRARLLQKLGPDQTNWLFPTAKPGEPITTLPSLGDGHASRDNVDDEIGALTGIGHGASNEWVIAGSRTETGKPILANDPHLDLSAPILWYLARIVTPEGSVKGATIPGAPAFVCSARTIRSPGA